jgi:glycosyltransferase involved in cell wall biosynthesis
MRKILLVIGQLGFGGAERQLLYLLQGLDRRRFQPLLCVLSPGQEIPEFQALGVPLVILPRYLPRYDPCPLFGLWSLTRRWRPDLIHAFMTIANFFAFITARTGRIPLLVSERNAEPPAGADKNRVHRWVERLVFSRSEAIVANSRAGAALAVETKGARPQKVYVIPNGINAGSFDNLGNPQAIRRELGLNPHTFTLGIIGSLTGKQKDHETFFRAMQSLSQRSSRKFQIVCVGGGPKLGETRLLADKLGLGERTFFTGVRTDVPEILGALDLVVSSSRWEGMPNVIMEAMAAGKPVVATAVGGTPELVIPGETGLLAPPQDPEALASASQTMLENPGRALEMGQAGRRRIEKFFSIEKMVRDTENIYQRLLS